MSPEEQQDRVCEDLRTAARFLLEAQCSALREFGASVAVFNAADTGVVDRKDRPVRTVVFIGSGVFTDDDLRELQRVCIGAVQDATQGERKETVIIQDNLPPKANEGGAS
jgi:hypothetical protein